MFAIKDMRGYYMKVILLPATPPYTAVFSPMVTVEETDKFETEQDAHNEIIWLIRDQMENPLKFEGYKVVEI